MKLHRHGNRDGGHAGYVPILVKFGVTPPMVFGAAFIAVVAAALRLWRIRFLFNAIHDYDPGAHALVGRFLAEGHSLYSEVVSVHPPLYDLTLGSIFRVFGYDYMVLPYLSVGLSLISLALVFLVARRMYGSVAGLVAAGLFAVEPMMVYLGRRGVQEAMGLCLVLIATYAVVLYFEHRRRRTLILSGFAVGLAIATKYVFIPAAMGLGCALLLLSLPNEMWRSVRRLGSLRVWGAYAVLFIGACALILFLQLVVELPVPLPFVDPIYPIPRHFATLLLVFVVPSLILWRQWALHLQVRRWGNAIWQAVCSEDLWVWGAGAAVGFFAVTGYFLVSAGPDFIEQTFIWQTGRSSTEVPSLVGIARLLSYSPAFFRMSLLSIIAMVPVSLALLNRRTFGRSDCLLAVLIVVTMAFSQGFYQLPRYYAAPLLFTLIALSSLARIDLSEMREWPPIGSLAVVVVLITSFVLSLGLLKHFSGYDVASSGRPTERAFYDATNDFLEVDGAGKVFATNPIYPALAESYESSASYDTFAEWFLKGGTGDEIVAGLRSEGVDHVVVDSWTRFWGAPPYSTVVSDVVGELRRQGSLVAVIEPDTSYWVEIYRLDAAPATLVNGDFSYWADYQGMRIPLGWNPVLIGGDGDSADIRASGESTYEGARFVVYEDGLTEPDNSSTHAGLTRRLAFPQSEVSTVVMPGVNTEALGAEPLGPAIHFLDGEGHSVILGFSDEVEEEQVSVCAECGHVAVIQPAPLHRWSEHSIDVGKYWRMAGWDIPDEVTLLVVLSAHADHPGYYTFHVAEITVGEPAL